MSTPRNNVYERASLAFNAALAGNLDAAGSALLAPNSLSPEERKTVGERLLGKDSGPLHKIVDVATNPFVLLGLTLSAVYPIATAERMLAFDGKLGGYLRRLVPGAKWFSDLHEIYRGTDIPDIFERISREMHSFMLDKNSKVGALVNGLQQTTGAALTRAEGVRIAAKLDGLDDPESPVWAAIRSHVAGAEAVALKPLTLTPAESKVYDGLKGQLRSTYDDVFGNPEHQAAINVALSVAGYEPQEFIKRLDAYFPHIKLRSKSEIEDAYREWVAGVGGSQRALSGANAASTERQASKAALERKHLLLPNPDDLKLAGLIDDGAHKALSEAFVTQEGLPVGRYSLQLLPSLEVYHQALARTRAWSVPLSEEALPLGRRVASELGQLKDSGDAVRARMLTDTYIPMATGRFSVEQSFASMSFSDARKKALDVIDSATWLPAGMRSFFKKPLESSPALSYQALGNKINSYLYMSTIGANPVSAATNLLQTTITTLPVLGAADTMAGVDRTIAGAGRYLEARTAGVTADEAFTKAFPAFSKTLFDIDPISREAMGHSMAEAYDSYINVPQGVRKTAEGAKSAMLWMFGQTERFNRLVAFEGAYAKATRELPGTMWRDVIDEQHHKLPSSGPLLEQAAGHFADRIARMTQFGGGYQNTPFGTLNLWAPLRQMTQFPLRMLGFAAGPGTTLGGGGETRNFGTIGRAMLASGLIYESGKQVLDLDISHGLLASALPSFQKDGPFAPLPLVPPLLQLVGAAGIGLAGGSFDELHRSLPLLVPGGIAASRAVGYVAPSLGAKLGRPHADYQNPTPDGRYNVFDGQNRLIGPMKGSQIFSRAVGLGTLTGDQSIGLEKYLAAQGARFADFRSRWSTAMLANDQAGLSALDAEFRKAYPEIGGQLGIRSIIPNGDVRALQLRRMRPRIERMLATLPPAAQQQFRAVIATSMSSDTGYSQPPQQSVPSGTMQRPASQNVPSNIGSYAMSQLSEAGDSTKSRLSQQAFASFQGY